MIDVLAIGLALVAFFGSESFWRSFACVALAGVLLVAGRIFPERG